MSVACVKGVFAFNKRTVPDPDNGGKPTALSAGETLVLLALAWRDKDGSCFPGDEELVTMTGLSRRTIFKYRKMLERRGLIEAPVDRSTKAGKGHNYTLHIPIGEDEAAPAKRDPVTQIKRDPFTHIEGDNVHECGQGCAQQYETTLAHDRKKKDIDRERAGASLSTLASNFSAQLISDGVPAKFIEKYARQWEAAGGYAGRVFVSRHNFVERMRAWWSAECNKDDYRSEVDTWQMAEEIASKWRRKTGQI